MIHSYPSIFNLGHKALAELLTVSVTVEEKVDGSQFSFGVSATGELWCRSKGMQLVVEAPEKMFSLAVDSVKAVQHLLKPEWVYRAEYLRTPKHNTLKYERVPKNHLLIFDINDGLESYLTVGDRLTECNRIGFESVPVLFQGMVTDVDQLRSLIDRVSFLGGPKIEGVVIKPIGYHLFGQDKKAIIGKFVSEDFKETHSKEWAEANPKGKDIIQMLGATYTAEARWEKAYQHLRDAGKLENTPRDIGLLMKEVPADILKECEAEIKEQLFKWAWKDVQRQITRGLPEWYKQKLMASQFQTEQSA